MSDFDELQERLEEPDFSEAPGRIVQQQTTYLKIAIRSKDGEHTYQINYIEKRRFRIDADWVDQIQIFDEHPVNLSERETNFSVYIGKKTINTHLVRSAVLKAFSDTFEEWYPPSESINPYVLNTSDLEINHCLLLSGPETLVKLLKTCLGFEATNLTILPAKRPSDIEKTPNSPGKVLTLGSSFVWADDFEVLKIS